MKCELCKAEMKCVRSLPIDKNGDIDRNNPVKRLRQYKCKVKTCTCEKIGIEEYT